MSEPTIIYWKKKYGWDKEIAKENKDIISYIDQAKKNNEDAIDKIKVMIEPLSDTFNFSLEERTNVAEIKAVKAVILESIVGTHPIRPTNDANKNLLRPTSFNDAMKGLKICWDQMKWILQRKQSNGDVDKPDVLNMVQNNYYGEGKSEATEKSPIKLVPGREVGGRKP